MRQRLGSILVVAAALPALLPACRSAQVPPEQGRAGNASVAGATRAAGAERRLAEAKAKVMSADYRADLAELARLREAVAPLADDPASGYLAHYWAGFAAWRLAINGANHGMSAADIKAHLARAAADFAASIRARDDFADGYAAAASVNGWLAGLSRNDAAALREHAALSGRLLARAKELAPDNPRVLWVAGGDLLFRPVAMGGSPERAMLIYRRALEAGDFTPAPSSPLPDWGKPELLMSLAYGHLNQAAPDLAAAREEADAALRLQPEWSYVRDVLVPQIEARRRQP